MILTTTCDIDYYPLLKCLLKSAAIHLSDAKFYLRLIDFDINIQNDILREVYNINHNTQVCFENPGLSHTRNKLKRNQTLLYDNIYNGLSHERETILNFRPIRWMVSERQCYCSNTRFRNINHLINQGEQVILYLDADIIIRKPLVELISLINNHDICIKLSITPKNKTFSYPDGHTWECGLIGVHNTTLSRDFFYKLQQRTEANMYFWDSDQFEFHFLYKDYKDKIKIHLLDNRFKDNGEGNKYSDDSYIWSGSHLNKIKNTAYINETKKYYTS